MVFKHFGDRIPLYVTINEPNHNAYCDYCVGNYPPNETNLQHYCQCAYNMAVCTAKAIREFRKLNLKAQIGVVQGCGRRPRFRIRRSTAMPSNIATISATTGFSIRRSRALTIRS